MPFFAAIKEEKSSNRQFPASEVNKRGFTWCGLRHIIRVFCYLFLPSFFRGERQWRLKRKKNGEEISLPPCFRENDPGQKGEKKRVSSFFALLAITAVSNKPFSSPFYFIASSGKVK